MEEFVPHYLPKEGKGIRGGGLLVTLDEGRGGVAKNSAAMAAQWFGQELFDDPNLAVDEEEDEEEEVLGGAAQRAGAHQGRSRIGQGLEGYHLWMVARRRQQEGQQRRSGG